MWRWYRLKQVLQEEDGIGVVEVILILVVLIGLVLIFKSQLTSLVETIFEKITSGKKLQACGYEPGNGVRICRVSERTSG